MAETPAGRCVLAFFKKKNGENFAAKLPETSVRPGDMVEIADMGFHRVVETVELIDRGPAYQAYSAAYPIHVALEVFRSHWRRYDGTL